MEKVALPPQCDLPASLEQALQEAFTHGALISEPEAARIIGFSSATLRREAARGKIETVQRGTRRAYTIEALRSYLAPVEPPVPGPARGTANVSTRSAGATDTNQAFSSPRMRALVRKMKANKKRGYVTRDDEGVP